LQCKHSLYSWLCLGKMVIHMPNRQFKIKPTDVIEIKVHDYTVVIDIAKGELNISAPQFTFEEKGSGCMLKMVPSFSGAHTIMGFYSDAAGLKPQASSPASCNPSCLNNKA